MKKLLFMVAIIAANFMNGQSTEITFNFDGANTMVISTNGYVLNKDGSGDLTQSTITIAATAPTTHGFSNAHYLPVKTSANGQAFNTTGGLKSTSSVGYWETVDTVDGANTTRTWTISRFFIQNVAGAVVGTDFKLSINSVKAAVDPDTNTVFATQTGIEVVSDFIVPILNFEGGADSYETGLSDLGGDISITEDFTNPNSSGINTSSKVLKLVKNIGAQPWDRFRLTSIAPVVTTADGSFFTLKFRSPKASGEISLAINGTNSATHRRNYFYSGTTIGDWILAEFDFSDNLSDITGVSRFDVAFDWSSGTNVSGAAEEYFIDDLQQDSASVLSVSNDSNEHKDVAVYPNPTNGIVNISDVSGIHTIIVSNVLGKVVKTLNASSQIDLSSLEAGLYILQGDNGFQTKVVKN